MDPCLADIFICILIRMVVIQKYYANATYEICHIVYVGVVLV
jgi:hypothetical protein